MSSIYGFVSDSPVPDARGRLSAMARALPDTWEDRGAGWLSETGRAAFGFGVHRDTPIVGQTAVELHSGTRCWVEGNFDEAVFGSSRPAEGLLQGFLNSGPDCVLDARGAFNVAWWVPREDRLVLASDHVGYRPLYVGRSRGATVFATHMPQLAAAGLIDLEADPEAFASLVGLTTLLGDETIFRDVRLLPAASVLEVRGGRHSCRRYWSLSEIEAHGTYDRARRDLLSETFLDATRRSLGNGSSALAITGGLDSRCVAAAASQCGLADTFTEGDSRSADFRIAERVADRLGLRHRNVTLDGGQVAAWLEPAMVLLGGNMAALEIHPCRHFLGERESADRIVLGLMGETARAAYPRPTDYLTPDFETLFQRVFRKLRSNAARDPNYDGLWRDGHLHLAGAAVDRLRRTLGSYTWQDTPLDVADYFYLEHRGRRHLSKGPILGRLGTETASPYLDRQWLEVVFAVPTRLRLGNRIQIDIIERLAPGLKSVAFAAPRAYTSRWQERLGERKNVIRRKSRLGRRAAPPAFDTAGWSRGSLRPAIEALLFERDAAYRRFLDASEVAARLAAHFSGARTHTHLVAALVAFEAAHGSWASSAATNRDRRPADERPVEILEA